MSDYTVKNLLDVEDSAPKFGMAPDLQAHFASGDLGLTRSGVSLQRVAPGVRVPFGHRHEQQEELYVVVEGGGRVKIGDEVLDVGRWDAVRVAADTMRAFEAGAEGLTILAFGAPKTGQNDAQMEPGWWTD